MSRRAIFVPYRPKNILNKSKRADHWFWSRYSAYPYLGCQHGCEFCYCREQKFSPYDDIADFPYIIKVKENAPELLRHALSRQPVDVIGVGDYQPLERKYFISRRMLEVCYDLGFPVFMLERSPLVLRDLDLIESIHQRARAVVVFSMIYAPGSPFEDRLRIMEHLAPPPQRRLAAMEKLAEKGIPTGICFMPVLPGLCDTKENIENVVRQVAGSGGQFAMIGGLTLSDQQRVYFMGILREKFPDLVGLYERLYPEGSYGLSPEWQRRISLILREMCEKHGICDRMPRPIIPGDKHTLNRQIVEILANRVYDLDLEKPSSEKAWKLRKAAWAIEDTPQDIRLIYRTMGRKGLESIPDIGLEMAQEVEKLINHSV